MPTTGNKVFQLVGPYFLSLASGVLEESLAFGNNCRRRKLQSLTIQSHTAVYTTTYIHMNSFTADPGDPIIGGGGREIAYRLFGNEQTTVNSLRY